jgi:hypothetical protein
MTTIYTGVLQQAAADKLNALPLPERALVAPVLRFRASDDADAQAAFVDMMYRLYGFSAEPGDFHIYTDGRKL